MRMLAERSIEMQKNLYIVFIDYEKAFDRVKHHEIMKDLEQIGIDQKDRRVIENLYWEQMAAISIDGDLNEWTNIKRGVRQGCVILPDLFSLYTELLMRKVIQGNLKVNGHPISDIRYADDTVLISDNERNLQEMLISFLKVPFIIRYQDEDEDFVNVQSSDFTSKMKVKSEDCTLTKRKQG